MIDYNYWLLTLGPSVRRPGPVYPLTEFSAFRKPIIITHGHRKGLSLLKISKGYIYPCPAGQIIALQFGSLKFFGILSNYQRIDASLDIAIHEGS